MFTLKEVIEVAICKSLATQRANKTSPFSVSDIATDVEEAVAHWINTQQYAGIHQELE